MKTKNIVIGILALLSFSVGARAQMATRSISGVNASEIVKNSPYSAEATSENIHTLADGNRIIRKTRTVMYRDSEGRTRTENYFSSGTTDIFITDPIAKVAYVLDPFLKTARRIPVKPKPEVRVAIPKTATVNKIIANVTVPTGYSTTSESLGTRTINGIEAEGRRSVTTIAPGANGNEKEIKVVSETWFAKDLRLLILTKRSDPENGDYTYQLNKINRQEPDKSLFSIPADYKISGENPSSNPE